MDRQTLRRWRRLEYNITGLRLPCLACSRLHEEQQQAHHNSQTDNTFARNPFRLRPHFHMVPMVDTPSHCYSPAL